MCSFVWSASVASPSFTENEERDTLEVVLRKHLALGLCVMREVWEGDLERGDFMTQEEEKEEEEDEEVGEDCEERERFDI